MTAKIRTESRWSWFTLSRCLIAVGLMGILAALTSTSLSATPPFKLFALDNGVGRGVWTPEQQATALQEAGFDGISYNYTTVSDLKKWVPAMSERRLTIFGLYFALRLQPEPTLPAGIRDAVQLLRGTGTTLWVTVPAPSKAGDHERSAIKGVQDLADLAAASGLRLALYPHRGFYISTAEEAMALAEKVQRPNIGVTVNLIHELGAGHGLRMREVIRKVASRLTMVTINGGTLKNGGRDSPIKLIGSGDYDVRPLLQALVEVDYGGPVGLQLYKVPGDPAANLSASMKAWRSFSFP